MKTDSIKSITRKIESIAGFTLQDNCHSVQIQLEGGHLSPIYIIGDGVVSGAQARLDGMTSDYAVLNGYVLPLVLGLLTQMGILDDRINLCIALPNSLASDRAGRSLIEGRLTNFLTGLHSYIYDRQARQLLITSVSFTIQGIAALCCKLLDEQGSFALRPDVLDIPLNVLDIGYGSSTFLRIDDKQQSAENGFVINKKLPGIKELCCWLQDDMSKAFGKTYYTWEDFLPYLLDEKQFYLSQYHMLSEKSSKSWLRRFFKSDELSSASGALSAENSGDELISAVRQRWTKDAVKVVQSYIPDTHEHLYITGGGALLLHDEIQDVFPEAVFLPDPINASAIGSVHIGTARSQANVVGIDLGSFSVKGAANGR